MKRYIIYRIIAISTVIFLCSIQKNWAQEGKHTEYINGQKEFYSRIIGMINPGIYNEKERDPDFDPCPLQELHDDFLGFKFTSIHTEQAGFLDCDGPTYLNIYDNGLYINNTGDIEYQCYLDKFHLKYGDLKSGTPKQEIIERFGIPLIQSELVFIYGCTLNGDPFAGIDDDSEIEDIDETDPNNYIPDFFFVFEDDKLIAVVYVIEHFCY